METWLSGLGSGFLASFLILACCAYVSWQRDAASFRRSRPQHVREHRCVKPRPKGAEGRSWACGECHQQWRIHWISGPGDSFALWNKHGVDINAIYRELMELPGEGAFSEFYWPEWTRR